MRKLYCLIIAVLSVAAVGATPRPPGPAVPEKASPSPSHLLNESTTSYGPVTRSKLDQHIEDYAREVLTKYEQGGDRTALSDNAMPIDAREYHTLHKYGVVLISAISRTAAELPLKRVYVRLDGRIFVLKEIASVRRDTPQDSLARKAFGQFREDSFYLLPASLLTANSLLFCDFAINREGFLIAQFDEPPPPFIASDRDRTQGKEPAADRFRTFIAREYPGILPEN